MLGCVIYWITYRFVDQFIRGKGLACYPRVVALGFRCAINGKIAVNLGPACTALVCCWC
jgi:hypothetical protein